jgi:UDP-glucuronate 4-epimerase
LIQFEDEITTATAATTTTIEDDSNRILFNETSSTYSTSNNVTEVTQGRRILVTGAAGFIGYHLSHLLKNEFGDIVIGLDNFNDYYSVELKRMRANLLKTQNVTIIEGDVCDEVLVDGLFREYKFTHVVHLAAQAGVRYSLDNPKAYVTANVMCHLNLLEAIRRYDTTVPFIYASSSSVYGLNDKIPFSEDDSVTKPSNVYGASKIAGEHMSSVYNHLYNIPVIGLRFFTVYGPLGRPDMAVFKWADLIAKNSPIPLFYKDEVVIKRDFTHVSDIVQGIEKTLRLNTFEIDNNAPQVFNLGNNHPESVDSLVSYLADGMKSEVKKRMMPLPETDMVATFANIDKAMSLLDFKPRVSLREGVSDFIQWFKDTYWPEDIVFTTFFSGKKDPERDIFIQQEFFKIKEWYDSVHSLNLHAIIFHDNLNQEFVDQYTTTNVRFVQVTLGPRSLNDERFFIYRKFLSERIRLNPEWAPKRVIMTDLFDVKYNKNPFDFMRQYEERHPDQSDNLFIGSEETTIAENEWSQTRLNQCIQEDWDFLKPTQLLNPGIVGAKVSTMMNFLKVYNKEMKGAPVSANCNTPMFNFVIRQSTELNSRIVTGSPFHSEFRKEDYSPEYFVKHK